MEIRQATNDELEEFVRILDVLWPNYLGLAELRRDLELMPEKQRLSLWFAIKGGEKVGVARLYRSIGAFHPQKWIGETDVWKNEGTIFISNGKAIVSVPIGYGTGLCSF